MKPCGRCTRSDQRNSVCMIKELPKPRHLAVPAPKWRVHPNQAVPHLVESIVYLSKNRAGGNPMTDPRRAWIKIKRQMQRQKYIPRRVPFVGCANAGFMFCQTAPNSNVQKASRHPPAQRCATDLFPRHRVRPESRQVPAAHRGPPAPSDAPHSNDRLGARVIKFNQRPVARCRRHIQPWPASHIITRRHHRIGNGRRGRREHSSSGANKVTFNGRCVMLPGWHR